MVVCERQVQTVVGFTHPAVTAAVHYGQNSFKSELEYDEREIAVTDARSLAARPSLDDYGFMLTGHETAVSDFTDPAQIETIYRQEMCDLVQGITGAEKVIVFHTQLRDNSPSAHTDIRRPAAVPHIDYNEDTFRLRAREEMGEEAEQWLCRRFAAYNVWRGVRPVREMPLAVADARTVREDDFRKTIIHEKPGEPTPYVGMPLTFNPDQRWYFFPDMQPNEALLFKQCDSDHDRIQWTPHVAIDVPSKADPTPRVSFEVRTLAFF
ncbi:CmcJ/NvfI family oxidoreductase [Allosphingosinicella sp.]|uniref:CmcJ/NvfI family oxidoreductase n=1 Tax=Allosphingosinicella sp. TaxID=2823234 RepID=UPI002FC1D882